MRLNPVLHQQNTYIAQSNPHPSLSVIPKVFFPPFQQGWLVDIWPKETQILHNGTERKIIYLSICPAASLYVSFLPLSIGPVDPCTLSFFSSLHPHLFSHSLVPPSSPFHLPSVAEAAAGQSLGRRGKVRLKAGRLAARRGQA